MYAQASNPAPDLFSRFRAAQLTAATIARHAVHCANDTERVSGSVDPRRLPASARALQLAADVAALGNAAGSGLLSPTLEPYLHADDVAAFSAALASRTPGIDVREALVRTNPNLSAAGLRDASRAIWMTPQGNVSDRVLDVILLGIEDGLLAFEEPSDDEEDAEMI